MPKLGTSKRPAIVRVRTQARAESIIAFCQQHGWKAIAGIEPYKDEDISDVQRLLGRSARTIAAPTTARNDACPCGSGRKYKNCCR